MRRGFSVIEVVAALALASLLLTGALGMLDQLRDATRRIAAAQGEQDATSNGLHLLRTTLVQAQPSTDSTRLFSGDATEAKFWSSCNAPGGWPEPCAVTLTVVPMGHRHGITARLADAAPTVVLVSTDSLTFVYLGANQGSGWTQRWQPSILPPSALGVIAGRDTMILPGGLRR